MHIPGVAEDVGDAQKAARRQRAELLEGSQRRQREVARRRARGREQEVGAAGRAADREVVGEHAAERSNDDAEADRAHLWRGERARATAVSK